MSIPAKPHPVWRFLCLTDPLSFLLSQSTWRCSQTRLTSTYHTDKEYMYMTMPVLVLFIHYQSKFTSTFLIYECHTNLFVLLYNQRVMTQTHNWMLRKSIVPLGSIHINKITSLKNVTPQGHTCKEQPITILKL